MIEIYNGDKDFIVSYKSKKEMLEDMNKYTNIYDGR
jgi:hypothetical protein